MLSPNDTKYCPSCQQHKPRTTEFFYPVKKKTKIALSGYCRNCANQKTKKYAHEKWFSDPNYREAKSAHAKQYAQDNRKSLKAFAKAKKSKLRAERWGVEGELKPQDFIDIFEDQNGRCFYCGITLSWEEDRGVIHDHMMPLSRGGANVKENVVITCMDCNASKGTKTPEEWQKVRGW